MSNDQTCRQIIEAAGPVFAEKGYQAATVREICSRAGVNLAAVNYYFGGKEQLYVETFKRAHPLDKAGIAMPEWPEGTPPETKLRDYIGTLMKRLTGVESAPWQGQMMLREMMQPTPACWELLQEFFREDFAILQSILGEILPPETPQHRREQIGFSIIAQCVHYRAARKVINMLVPPSRRETHYQSEQLAGHIAAFTLAALGLGPPVVAAGGSAKLHEEAGKVSAERN